MTYIHLEDICLLGATTLLASYQMARFAIKVGAQRRKHKIEPPITSGPPEFERAIRAQQNCVEFFGLFIATMWVAGLFFHQLAACAGALYYMFGRERYFNGYVEDAKKRLPGFKSSTTALKALLGMGSIGLVQIIMRVYFGINLKAYIGL